MENCSSFFASNFEGNFSQFFSSCPVVGGSIVGALVALGIFVGLILLVGLYVYTSLAWQSIAKKLKYRFSWLAWIPIVRIAMILKLGNFHWAWIFLILIPVFGWVALIVLFIIALWRIFVKRKYPGWFSLALLIPDVGGVLYLISIGIAAWARKR